MLRLLRVLSALTILTACCGGGRAPTAFGAERPSVLFVAIDDLNDWIGCLGGHPQAQTPNMDRLAARGMLFTNAHCTASLCNPSRASVMTGTLPSTNGVHGNQQDWRESPYLRGHETLPEYFRNRGYWTGGCGKMYHANHGCECGALNGGHGGLRGFNHPASWTERFPSHNQQLPKLPVMTGRNFNGLGIWHWDWGAIDVSEAAMEDAQAAEWAVSKLRERREQPFFLGVGLYAPHGPWYCPPAYFERHPLSEVQLPELNPPDDLEDVPPIARRHLRGYFSDHHARVTENGLYEAAVQAYLAQITFADAMLGRVLDALDAREQAENTVIVLWSDHGWHLGEKQKWHKGTNWEEGTRVPLIVVAPGVAEPGTTCEEPVSLVDLYPTLLELCGLPDDERLDGESLVPLLRDPGRVRERPAYTVNGGRHQSVRSKRWRYIRYADGSEELYDHQHDPTEYRNLAGDPQYADVKEELAAFFPPEIRRAPYEAAPPNEPGFRPIFNGYDLTSWEGDAELWRVEDGAIVGETTSDSPLRENSFLVWRGTEPDNFELRLRFRVIGNNNSGVQYRSRERADLGEWVMSGYQADIHPVFVNLGMLYHEKGRGIIARRGEQVVVTADGRKMLAGRIPPEGGRAQADRDRAADSDGGGGADRSQPVDLAAWHDLTIIAEGNHLVHKVDGVTTVDVWDHDPQGRALKGLIGLQLHRGEPMRAEFKDLRLKDLPPGELTPPEKTPLPDDAAEVHTPRRRARRANR